MPKDKPEIRFAGYTDAWEKRKLENFTKSYSGGTPSVSKSDYYGGEIPFIRSAEINSDSTDLYLTEVGLKNSSAKMVQYGDILYALYGATSGEVGISRIHGAINQAILAIKPTEGDDSQFIMQWLRKQKGHIINTYLQGGQGNLSGSIVKSLEVRTPVNKNEEFKIGGLLRKIDNLIAVNQRKVDLLKELKKGFLQKMFPKNGEDKPEIRFSGFTDAWEKRKLKDMAKYKNGKGHEDKQSETGMLELVNLNSIGIEGGFKHSGKYVDSADDTLLKNDLVMILSDVGHGNLLGRVALIPESNKFVLNQRVALLRPNKTGNSQFLFSYINAHQRYFKSQGAGMSQLNISKSSVENFNDFVPLVEEQKKIGTFLHNLDQLITVNQRRVDLLKQEKKALLQKMFV